MTEQEAIKYLKDANKSNQMLCILPKSDIGKCLINALEVNQQYRAIGTPEECRAAVEKQKSKKMVIKNDNGRPRRACGGCGCFVLPASRFCSKCGQKLDWSDEE